MTDYQQGFIDKCADMGDMFGFGKKKQDSAVPEAIGGTAGGIAGAAMGHQVMRYSPGARLELGRILGTKGNITGKLLKAYGKRMIPFALVTAALGAVAGHQMEDRG